MKTTKDYLDVIKENEPELRSKYGIRSLRIFGSVARGEHHDGSDLDVFVEMEPSLLLKVDLTHFLEEKLQMPVDVVRKHKHINPFLLNEIEHDGIHVF